MIVGDLKIRIKARSSGSAGPDGAPSGLTLTVVNSTTIKLDWTNGSTNEDGIIIERAGYDGGYSVIHTTAPAVITYNDTTATDNYYTYRLRAYKGSQYSAYCTAVINSVPLVIYDGNTIAWYDAADLTTITKDANEHVTRWNNKMGVATYDLTSVEGTPHWVTPDSILFDGVGDSLRRSFTMLQPYIIYIVFKQITWTANDRILDGSIAARNYLYQVTASPQMRAGGGSLSGLTGTQLLVNTWGILRLLFNTTASKLIVFDNTPITGDFGANVPAGFTIGARGGGGSQWSNIQVKDIIIRNVVDDIADENDIWQYLAVKDNIVNASVFDKGKVVFTFDDGYADNYSYVLPLFQSESVKGTFYIVSDWVGTEGYVTWAQLQAMNAAGMDIQCHSKSHPELTSLSKAQIEAEMDAVTTAFTTNSLPAPLHHSYPFGHYDANVIDAVDGKRTTARLATSGYVYKNSNKYTLSASSYGTDYTTKMDVAKANKSAIIFYTHTSGSVLQTAVDYAQSIGIDIISMSELNALMV